MALADRAPVLLDLRRERPGSGIARVIGAWRQEAAADPEPIALLEASAMSDRSPWPTEPRRLRAAARAAGAEVLHTVYPYVLAPAGVRNVLTIHDTLMLDRDPARAAVARLVLGQNLRRAAVVVTVSAYARDAICDRLGLDPARVQVAHNGVAPAPAGRPDTASPYAVYVGNAKPHKHVDELLSWGGEALAAHGLRLVLVVGTEDRDRLLAAHPKADVRTGLSEDALAELLGGATLYVSLAEGEGFGLPPLEAAARGVPAVLHDAGAHREVMGDAAVLCTLDRDDVVAAVGRALAGRDTFTRAARARAAELTWAASWRAVRAAHRRALER